MAQKLNSTNLRLKKRLNWNVIFSTQNFNDFSIGIELHGSVSDEFTDNQYSSLKNLIGELKQLFPSIKDSNILGHSEIAPKRKNDPGPNFKWEEIR